jgi:hypothetical protein
MWHAHLRIWLRPKAALGSPVAQENAPWSLGGQVLRSSNDPLLICH